MTRRMRQIVAAMQRGAQIFYVDNDSSRGMHPALCEGRSAQTLRRPLIDRLVWSGVLDPVPNVMPGHEPDEWKLSTTYSNNGLKKEGG